MKTMFRGSLPVAIILVLQFVSGCVSVGGVFQSGFWIGIVLAAIAVGLVLWLVSKMRGGGGSSSSSNTDISQP
jgi:membrane protein implicated in regulation of membrane protease activity